MGGRLGWVEGYEERGTGPTPGVHWMRYSLRGLADRGLLGQNDVSNLLVKSDLRDFGWYMFVAEPDPNIPEDLPALVDNVDGYVIFIHGWTGSHVIWEDMPGSVINRNQRLVSLAVDYNGFGLSPFADRTPEYQECSPAAAMKVIEQWLEILTLRRPPGDRNLKTINFVGHSMGGAALFFVDEAMYRIGEVTRTALAPALLIDDERGRTFFQTLGLGIGLVGRLQFLESIERLVSPRILETLSNGASEEVRQEHRRIYDATPRSVTARTLAAMGTIKDTPMPKKWEFMQVFLGHKDVLVGLLPMLDLLNQLQFDVNQIKVTLGTHYFFSIGEEWIRVNTPNRRNVVDAILHLHVRALQKQRTG